VLLGIKESYLFLKNSLGLVVHPFKTLRGLQREKDRSQQLLFLVWPVVMLLIGLISLWQGVLIVIGWVLIGLAVFVFGYLGYWEMKVWGVK